MKHLLFIGAFIMAVCTFGWVVSFQHNSRPSRCSLDGSQIEPLYEVIIIQKDELSRNFACVLSARIWFSENSGQVSSIFVTDEATGKKIKAEQAFYVASEVVTTPHTGNRIHVFAEESKARLHAIQFKGKLIENPFQAQEKEPVLLVRHRTNYPNNPGFLFPSSPNPLSLPAKTALIKQQDCSYLPQEHSTRFSEGYSSPPDKPPRPLV